MALAMVAHCWKDLNRASNNDTENFRCFRIDSKFSTATQAEVTSNKDRDTACEVFRNSYYGHSYYVYCRQSWKSLKQFIFLSTAT